MNDELQKKLIEWVQGFSDIASTEIPLFVKECAMYGSACNGFLLGLSIFISLTCIVTIYKYLLNLKEESEAIICTSIIILLISVVTIFFTIDGFCKAYFAPRLYVIERFTK